MPSQATTLKKLSRIGVLAVALICNVALAGRLFGIPTLASVVPGWPRMALISILCFLLCGGLVFELTLPTSDNKYFNLARAGAVGLVLAIGASTLVMFVGSSGLSRTIAASGAGFLFGPTLGRISPGIALNFMLLAAALMTPRGNRWGQIYSGLIAVGLAITGLNLVGYAYGIAALSRTSTVSVMSLPTMLSFILLFTSALLARPFSGWTAIIFAADSGGIAARRFLPAVLILPFVMNGLLVLAYHARPFEVPFGFAILAVVMSVGLGGATIVIATWLAQHEDERRRSQGLLEAIVDNSAAVIYVKDLIGRYLLVNHRFSDIFHVERQAMIGKTDYDIFTKQEADAFRAMDNRVVRATHPLTEEEVAPLDDGLHTYVSVKAPLRDITGQLYAIFGISTDITERKRNEEALVASEERTRLIVETALDAVISIDSDGRITGWNSQAEQIFGWSREDALGRPVNETIMPIASREAHRRGLARYLAMGEARVLNKRIELMALHRNGREFPIELAITPIRSDGALGFTAFARDITERKGAETRLQAQLERLALLERITRAVGQRQDLQSIFQVVVRSLEDRMPADFVCICSHDPVKGALIVNHVGVNSAPLAHELGIVEHATIPVDGNGLSRCLKGELVYESDIAEIDFLFPRRLACQGLRSLIIAPLMIETEVFGCLVVSRLKESAFGSADCEFLRQLGNHVALAAHQARLRGSLEDAYDDLKQTRQAVMQQERLRALGQMASGIAHDINNAISPVAVYTQSLLEREPDLSSRVHSYLETVGRVIKDVSATVSRMRDFYRRPDSDTELQAINLNEIVPQVVDLTRARWSDMPQQRGIVIRVATQLEENLPLVMANAAELREIAINLIFNAVDALPQGGTVIVRTASTPDPSEPDLQRVELEVEDNGVGMDEDTRRRCLEPFFTTKGERGTGLGLVMVYGAVQRHKAKLDIDSAPGKGTRVKLDFGAMQTKMERERTVKVAETPALRLLLVDDDPAVLHSTRVVLELDGHTVVAADGGGAGIDALRAAKGSGQYFDVMVTDLGMPYIDGYQVAQAAKELFPATTVVLVTGWGRKVEDTDNPSVHVDYMLPKPLDLNELRSVFAHRSGTNG